MTASRARARGRPDAHAGRPARPRAPPRRSARSPSRSRPRKVAATDRPVNVCPRCFMAIPATGLCDNCD